MEPMRVPLRYVEDLSDARTKLLIFKPSSEGMQDVQKRCPARPQRRRGRGVPLRYVEPLSEVRTKLAAFFNILRLPPPPFAGDKHMYPKGEIGHGMGQNAGPKSFGIVQQPAVGHPCHHAGQPQIML